MNPASRTSTVTGVLFSGNCVGKPSLRAKSKKPFITTGVEGVVYLQKQQQLTH
jgi:hypothetical protein